MNHYQGREGTRTWSIRLLQDIQSRGIGILGHVLLDGRMEPGEKIENFKDIPHSELERFEI